ncbi:hypothetical protein SODG_003315 [Sodalis praecaptivus]
MNSELFALLRDYRVIELNHQYEPLMPVWPTHPRFSAMMWKPTRRETATTIIYCN